MDDQAIEQVYKEVSGAAFAEHAETIQDALDELRGSDGVEIRAALVDLFPVGPVQVNTASVRAIADALAAGHRVTFDAATGKFSDDT